MMEDAVLTEEGTTTAELVKEEEDNAEIVDVAVGTRVDEVAELELATTEDELVRNAFGTAFRTVREFPTRDLRFTVLDDELELALIFKSAVRWELTLGCASRVERSPFRLEYFEVVFCFKLEDVGC